MGKKTEKRVLSRNKSLVSTQQTTVIHKSKKNYTRKNKHKNKEI